MLKKFLLLFLFNNVDLFSFNLFEYKDKVYPILIKNYIMNNNTTNMNDIN